MNKKTEMLTKAAVKHIALSILNTASIATKIITKQLHW